MTEALYLTDSYLKEFSAEVKEAKSPTEIVLDRTAFYAQGGGQPFDTGVLKKGEETYNVTAVRKKDGEIVHTVDREGLKAGDRVEGTIDWERRYRLMRMHTASHVLAAVFHGAEGALITGNQLDVDQSRCDYSIESFDREWIEQVVAKTNALLAQGHEVTFSFLPREEALKIPGMVKLAGALPPAVKELRILRIGDVDTQADGGTHVKNTKECGKVEIVKLENKGRSNRRLYFTLIDA